MTTSSLPIHPHRASGPSRVIQGYFPGGKPRIIQASLAPEARVRPPTPAPLQARPALAPPPTMPGRPAARPILPTNGSQPRALQPATPARPLAPRPILPQRAIPAAIQPHANDAFLLPANFTLEPRGSGQPLPEPIRKKMEAFFNTTF